MCFICVCSYLAAVVLVVSRYMLWPMLTAWLSGNYLICYLGKKAIGARVSVEFYNNEDGAGDNATKWYRGTIIAYNKRGHTVSFDGYGPEHNETIKSLRKAMERGEVNNNT